MNSKLVSVSKFLSLVLRHKPEEIGLMLDPNGWADIDQLLQLAANKGTQITRQVLEEVVAVNDKKRFSISADGKKIRANQGHSVEVELNLVSCEPPEVLFHGTASRFVDSIKQQGLLPGQRQHVHLSATEDVALTVGKRHGKPCILKIRAKDMATQGHAFYLSENKVWLTDKVPLEFIDFPAESA